MSIYRIFIEECLQLGCLRVGDASKIRCIVDAGLRIASHRKKCVHRGNFDAKKIVIVTHEILPPGCNIT